MRFTPLFADTRRQAGPADPGSDIEPGGGEAITEQACRRVLLEAELRPFVRRSATREWVTGLTSA
jgi:hypothetical protein